MGNQPEPMRADFEFPSTKEEAKARPNIKGLFDPYTLSLLYWFLIRGHNCFL